MRLMKIETLMIAFFLFVFNIFKDSLRFLVQDSLVNYTQMVVDSCWQVVDIKDEFMWSENDLVNSYIK